MRDLGGGNDAVNQPVGHIGLSCVPGLARSLFMLQELVAVQLREAS